MNDYYAVKITLTPCCEEATDVLSAMLGDAGYESFVADADSLTAYIKAKDYDAQAVAQVMDDFYYDCHYEIEATFVPGRDWNAEWEKNYFKPIIVDDRCVIHSSFHTGYPQLEYDIVIDPKMAFGTGHHATTSLVISRLLSLDLDHKTVIDMGTGTGILAILSAMLGASPVFAIEIDPFAYANAIDNVALNGHSEIHLYNGDASVLPTLPEADVFVANINRNIITADIDAYSSRLKTGGTMLLSGFYEHDIPVVMEAAAPLGLREVDHSVKGDGWTCLCLVKS